MTAYVSRSSGAITGVYRNPQPRLAEEAVDDASPEVVAFLASMQPKMSFPDRDTLMAAAAGMISDINAYQAVQDTGTAAQIQARDHSALKGLAQDMKLVLKCLIATFGN